MKVFFLMLAAFGALAGEEAISGGPMAAINGYLDVDGCRIYYEMQGNGPVIVLLHDGLLPGITWDDVWQSLATSHRVIRYDRRGYGRSELPTRSYSSTDDLRQLLMHLKVEHAVIVGSSSGAAVSIDFAIEDSQMVDGLFLIGPVVHGMEFSQEFRERARRNNEPMERDEVRGMARNWSEDRFLLAGANEKVRHKIYDQLVDSAEKLKKLDAVLEAKLSPPASQRLSEIKAPTLIIVGGADIEDVQKHARAIKAGIPHSTLEVIRNAGHLLQLERPDEIAKRIAAFAESRR